MNEVTKSEVTKSFEKNGYVHLEDFLQKESCSELVTALNELIEKGRTEKDEQCPLSEAIHGAPVFDSLLEQLVPNFELASGKKLFPTYAYARLYMPGEVLRPHKDRPSCEISATLTLGFEGKPWPIFMADGDVWDEELGTKGETKNEEAITMATGDAVLYRGCEKLHWREAFEGKWQAQVFLHYVDQNGPHADCKYDKRKRLAHHDVQIVSHEYIAVTDAVTPEACPRIIAECEKIEGEQAGVGGDIDGRIDKSIRDVKRVCLPIHRGIATAMSGIGFNANHRAWRFDVNYANQCEFLKYDIDGHYHAHIDTFFNQETPECRKLTVLLFLNDDFEGGKFFLQLSDKKSYPPQDPGTVLVFPSFMVHGVEPVTKGIRRSLVTWLVGPWFR